MKKRILAILGWAILVAASAFGGLLVFCFVVVGLDDLHERWHDAGHFPDGQVVGALAAAGLEWEDYLCQCDLDVPVDPNGETQHVAIEWRPGRVGWRHERSIMSREEVRMVDADLPAEELVAVIREMAENAAACQKEKEAHDE